MRFIKIVIGIASVFLLISCGEKPTADFTWTPTEPKVRQEVKFTNLSTNAKSYSWNFGDMSIGNEKNPTHVYQRKGNFIVDLLAYNGLKSDEKTVIIVVTD